MARAVRGRLPRMLWVALGSTFLFTFGTLLGLPLMSLGFGGLVAALYLHTPDLLPYALTTVAVAGAAEYLAIHFESKGMTQALAQGAAMLLFGRVLGPFVGALAWEEALGEGFDPTDLLRILRARGMRLLGVIAVLVIASLAP